MTCEPMHSAQAQSVRVTEKIYFGLVGHHAATWQEVRINVHLILISASSPYVLSYRSTYSYVNTVGYFSKLLIEILFTNGWKQSFAKVPIPKLNLHNGAAFRLRQKLRRDLPENLTFQHYITSIIKLYTVCFWIRDNQLYSKSSYISARNKSWLYCSLSHVQL